MSSLAVIIERNTGLPSVPPQAKPVASKPGYLKLRLTFLTDQPKHYRSYQLLVMYGLRGPFSEEAYALVPAKSVTTTDLVSYLPVFARLQRECVIPRTARLVKVAICDEDNTTLAYVCR